MAASVALGLIGCSERARELEWEIAFGAGVSDARALRVETRILAGGCTSAEEVYGADVRPSAPTGPRPDALSPGAYGFSAVAVDDGCVPFARGCTQVTLPLADGERVRVMLDADDSAMARCPASACMTGVCNGIDAGGGDATVDADGAAPDAFDAAPDAALGGQADVCETDGDCMDGFSCVLVRSDGAPPYLCARDCMTDADCPDAPGSVCRDRGADRVCTTNCDPRDVEACPMGTKCVVIGNSGEETQCAAAGTGGCAGGDFCPPGRRCCCETIIGCRPYCDTREPTAGQCDAGQDCLPMNMIGPWGVCL